MKKSITYLAMAAIAVTLSLSSCKKSDDDTTAGKSCDDLIEIYTNAYLTYISDQTEENCEAFLDATQDVLNGCNTLLTASQRQEYQNAINNTDCSNSN